MAPGTHPVTHAIPLHRTPFEDADSDLVGKALKSGLLVGDGAASHVLAAAARRTLGCSHAFTTPSCTHALELMMRALPLEPGDEVICPSFTFVSAANAVMLAGGRVVFAEVEPDTLNLAPPRAASRITGRTRALITGHYAGVAFGLEELERLAEAHGCAFLEDAAHALGGRFNDQPLGTLGAAGAFSFHGTKNVVSGEGGMFVTSDPEMADRAEIIREKGTDRSRFTRDEIDRYTWQEIGSSYLMSDLLATLVLSQWQRLEAITAARRARIGGRPVVAPPALSLSLARRSAIGRRRRVCLLRPACLMFAERPAGIMRCRAGQVLVGRAVRPGRRARSRRARRIRRGICAAAGRDGGIDMTIVAVDHKFRVARQAAERLRNAGVDCGLVNLRYLKPLPEHALAEILSTIPRVVTLEEGVLDGGVGSAIATGLRSPAHVRSASPR